MVATAAIIGGVLAAKAGMDYIGAREQAKAAEDAAVRQQMAGQLAVGVQEAGRRTAREELLGGERRGQEFSQMRYDLLGDGRRIADLRRQGIQATYDPQRAYGAEALSRLRRAQAGDMSAVTLDPGYQFRQQQGEQAINRAAAAAGSFGGGRNLQDLAGFSQGLASQEYGNAMNRLLQAQQVGSAANMARNQVAQTGLAQQLGLLQAQSGVLADKQNLTSSLGAQLGQLEQGTAVAKGNMLLGNQAQVNQYNLAAANSRAQGITNFGNTLTQGGMLYLMRPDLFGGAPSGAESFSL